MNTVEIVKKEHSRKQVEVLVDRYKDLVNSGKVKSYNEAQTRNELIEPLFEFLGWDMRNFSGEGDVTTEEAVSGGRVDLAFRINNVPSFFLEAKSMKVDLDEWKWAEQAINYSWNRGVTWSVLTDFEALKVFNAEIPPRSLSQNLFFELNWSEYLDRFDQLWLLSKDSIEGKLLDKQAEQWGKLAKRKQVGEKLFDDLMKWRNSLTRDIKNNNSVDKYALDEGVQKILDRLIFIRTAEDRSIERNILLSLVREWESKGRKHNIYKRIIEGFRWFDENYNSKLFTPHVCEDWKTSDDVLSKIIKGLYETEDGYRYDFSAISVDVLGGIYEQYLSHVQGQEDKDRESKTKRKSQGIYYTPKYVVEYLIEQTLGERIGKAKKKDLEGIKVLDPACGSGSFLSSAFDKLLEAKSKINPQTGLFDRFDVLKNNIYGVDLDEQAVEIAQLTLLLRVLRKRTKLPTLSHNLRVGNSLVSGEPDELEGIFGSHWSDQRGFNWKVEFPEVFKEGGFDVIVGNPPYVFARGKSFDEATKNYYYSKYRLANYQLNTFLLFIERAYYLLKEGGYLGFIVPNTWLTIDTLAPFRKFLLEETGGLQIVNIYDKVFSDANVDTCLIVFRKGRRSKVTVGEFKEGHFITVGKFVPSTFEKNNYIINISLVKDQNKMEILRKVSERSKPLSELATVKAGLKAYETGKGTPRQTDEMKKKRIYHSKVKIDDSYTKYLEGRDVMRYKLGWGGQYLRHGDCLAAPRRCELFTEPRILVRQIPSLPPYSINAIYTNEHLLNDINSMIVYKFHDTRPLYILGILNSKLTTFWFANTFDKFQRKTFPQFKVKELAIFPVPKASDREQTEVAKLVQLMLDLQKEASKTIKGTDKYKRQIAEIERIDEQIDRLIYKIYELTAKEVKLVESLGKLSKNINSNV